MKLQGLEKSNPVAVIWRVPRGHTLSGIEILMRKSRVPLWLMNFHLTLSYRLKGTLCRFLELFLQLFQFFFDICLSKFILLSLPKLKSLSLQLIKFILFCLKLLPVCHVLKRYVRQKSKWIILFLLLMFPLQESQSDRICYPIFENNLLIYFSCFLVVYISRWCLLLITLSWPKVKVLAQNFDHFCHNTCSKIWPLENFCYSRFAWTHIP